MSDRLCSIDGCDRPHLARGWCSAHYTRWKRGSTRTVPIGDRSPPAHPNPWMGLVACTSCGSAEWTLPWEPGDSCWHCVACGAWFEIAGKTVAA